MSFSAIWAEGSAGELGRGNDLPWARNKTDMEWFRKHTVGKAIVMGYRTWKSLGCKCLPGRINIVLTKDAIFGMKSLNLHESINEPYWATDLDFIEAVLGTDMEIMIIGGANTYQMYADRISRVYRTVFLANFDHTVAIGSNVDDLDMVYYDGFSHPDLLFSIHEVVDEPLVITAHQKS